MEKKPKATKAKAPTKWEILKTKARFTKEYLKGQFVEKGKTYTPRMLVHSSKYDDELFLQKYRDRRKKRKKAAYRSRRRRRK